MLQIMRTSIAFLLPQPITIPDRIAADGWWLTAVAPQEKRSVLEIVGGTTHEGMNDRRSLGTGRSPDLFERAPAAISPES
jgi:hypothetical protein